MKIKCLTILAALCALMLGYGFVSQMGAAQRQSHRTMNVPAEYGALRTATGEDLVFEAKDGTLTLVNSVSGVVKVVIKRTQSERP